MKNTELDFDWSCLPEGAKWIAMDRTSQWYLYTEKPELGNNIWTYDDVSVLIPSKYEPTNFTGNWKESRFEVPKNEEE